MTMTGPSYILDFFWFFLNDFNASAMVHLLDYDLHQSGGFMAGRTVVWMAVTTLAACKAQAQSDVYNFYFQKGGAPQTVIQGAGGQGVVGAPVQQSPVVIPPVPEVQPTSVMTTAPVAAPAATVETKVEQTSDSALLDQKTWEIHLGPTRFEDSVGSATAFTLGLQHNFNRYMAARLQGQLLAVESADYNRPMNQRDQGPNKWGGLASFVFTPLHMDLMGHKLIRVGGLVGLRSERAWSNDYSDSVKTTIQPFAGASVGVNLNENVGIEGSVAMVNGGKIGQATASLVFVF